MNTFVALSFIVLSLTVMGIHGGSDDYHDCHLQPDSGYKCTDGTVVDPNIIWYFANMTSGYCEEITPLYKGCGGNSNRFPDITTCEGICAHQGDARPSL